MLRQIGSPDYPTIASAMQNLPDSVLTGRETLELELLPGLYRERVHTSIPRLSLRGEGAVISGSERAGHTFETPTFYAESDTLELTGLTIENTAGPGSQAIALALNCRRAYITDCRILGCQDTLFLAPLPPSPVLPDGFKGSEHWRVRPYCQSLFTRCEIAGDIDFIFGGGDAVFEACDIRSLRPGYITAASTPEGQASGFVFRACRLISDCPPGSCYLGRPWRAHARTTFIRCHLGAHIHPAGWHDWDKPHTAFYAEFASKGPGASPSTRAPWTRTIAEPLDRARELQSLAQAGLYYTHDIYDRERFERIRDMSFEMLALGRDLDDVRDAFRLETGYQTPKLDCRAAIIRDGRILLVQENDGTWAMPGGWVDVNTTIAESTIKEAKEEAGLDITCRRLIAVQDRERHNTPPHAFRIVKVFMLCDAAGGAFAPNSETIASGYFSPSELPPLNLGKTTPAQIALCLEAAASETWEARFD